MKCEFTFSHFKKIKEIKDDLQITISIYLALTCN